MALLKGVVQDGRAALQQHTGRDLDKRDSPGIETALGGLRAQPRAND